jgi:hypothetical protein
MDLGKVKAQVRSKDVLVLPSYRMKTNLMLAALEVPEFLISNLTNGWRTSDRRIVTVMSI